MQTVDTGELLAQFIREQLAEQGANTGADTVSAIVSNIRWYPNKAGAVLIVTKGRKPKLLATISPKSGRYSHLYPSWKPALDELDARKRANNTTRESHAGISTGVTPV